MSDQPKVVACIDGSGAAGTVCDYAAWASQRLQAPLELLHVLDHSQSPAHSDLSGNIGLGSREHLLVELAELDEKRGRLLREQGKSLLEAAARRVAVNASAAWRIGGHSARAGRRNSATGDGTAG